VATDPTDLYPVIAQIAAVFAGFGSLSSGIGQRRGGDDARVDAFRLGMMLFASLSATLLGLLPATLSGLSMGEQGSVRVAAAIAVIALVIYVPVPLTRMRKLRHVTGFNRLGVAANGACSFTALFAFALCALGRPAGFYPGLYLLGLLSLLGSSIVMFSRVILSMLRPHSEARDREL
jgi:hypothetical protein